MPTAEMSRIELLQTEVVGSGKGWVVPLTRRVKSIFPICGQCSNSINIISSKVTWLEHDFVLRVAESEFYL